MREFFDLADPTQGRLLAACLVESLPACLIRDIARLGRTLRKWKDAFLAYFDTTGASNGIIEMGRRTARVFRNHTNYRL